MKIISLQAENFKRLSAVEITPDGHMVEITGRNGQGKSSVLDAIWAALNNAGLDLAKPIRKGAKSAVIKLDLGNLKVRRTFTEAGAYLTVETEDGAKYGAPQTVLDKLLGALTFDPLAFIRLKPKQQFEELRKIVKLDVDLTEHAKLDKADFDARTEINRQAKLKRAAVDAIIVPEGVAEDDDGPTPTNHLLDELAQVGEFNANIERRKERRAEVTKSIDDGMQRIATLETERNNLFARLKVIDQGIEEAKEANLANQKRLDEAEPLPQPKDATEVRTRLEALEAKNRALETRNRRRAVEAEAVALEGQAEALTAAMNDRAAIRKKAIETAEMPVKGLGLGDDAVTFNEIPLEQASSAEQLQVSMAIAMAANPKLRVIRIQDGSLLDPDSLATIGKMAEENDYQVWIERVDTSGKVGFVIEDGHIAIKAQAAEQERDPRDVLESSFREG